ncbi:MAG: ATP-binding protein [Capnocytophaga gingivalis]|jgi:AAA ATPase central domain protein|uniref:ATP-binding protein n=1 Tax=Capnocytophaga gingivalis TaxID=1017 RepID=UPI0036174701
MDYSPKVLEVIQKIKTTATEVQEGLYFLEDFNKRAGKFYEIKISNRVGILIEEDLCKENKKLEEALYFRKNLILRDYKDFIKELPNVYIFKNKEKMEEQKANTATNNGKQEEMVFIPQVPKFSLERVILPPSVKEDILLSLTLIENQKRIYEDWGFEEVDAKPKLILNFYGPPGTGKTMVSHAVAKMLNKNILAVNYAEIESKYVGDAPKNLFKAFNTAKESDAVLFFDEADSFLGKRIQNVSSSSDQAINSLRSQMLILLEDFEGVVVFATNLADNYDKAFESRILKHIHFDLPTLENREAIISITIPSKVPFSKEVNREELCKKLAEISEGFSGREIKNAVLESLTSAVQQSTETIGETVFLEGFKKHKERLEKFEQERKQKGGISKEVKERIESKIKEKLAQEKVEDTPEKTESPEEK